MAELLRPPPDEPWPVRLRRLVQGVSPWAVVGGAATLLVAAVVGWWLLRPPRSPVEATLPFTPTTSAAAVASERTLVVQIAGAVAQPGVYRMATGSRVDDLLAAAGGTTAEGDPQRVNLAARLQDGERVYIPRAGEAVDPAQDASSAPGGPIDLNVATTSQLEALPGIGPSTAAAIIARRTAIGRFRRVDDLLDVPGIGPAKLESFRKLVTVEP